MALYGLSIFNLHFWGFGIPFIFAGAWLLVRAYRFQQMVKEANTSSPAARLDSKRYTPPNRRKAS
jgi:hypothetical protein